MKRKTLLRQSFQYLSNDTKLHHFEQFWEFGNNPYRPSSHSKSFHRSSSAILNQSMSNLDLMCRKASLVTQQLLNLHPSIRARWSDSQQMLLRCTYLESHNQVNSPVDNWCPFLGRVWLEVVGFLLKMGLADIATHQQIALKVARFVHQWECYDWFAEAPVKTTARKKN